MGSETESTNGGTTEHRKSRGVSRRPRPWSDPTVARVSSRSVSRRVRRQPADDAENRMRSLPRRTAKKTVDRGGGEKAHCCVHSLRVWGPTLTMVNQTCLLLLHAQPVCGPIDWFGQDLLSSFRPTVSYVSSSASLFAYTFVGEYS